MRSPYDRYRGGGDLSTLSDAAKRGELLYSSSERGGCFQCQEDGALAAGFVLKAARLRAVGTGRPQVFSTLEYQLTRPQIADSLNPLKN
jgi:cytochrome c peroxidase